MKANRKMKILEDDKADVRMVGLLVSTLVIIVIGLLVYWQISEAIDITNADGRTAWGNVNTTANTVFTLAPIIAIVLIASIILAAVSGFGAGPRGGI